MIFKNFTCYKLELDNVKHVMRYMYFLIFTVLFDLMKTGKMFRHVV